MLDELAGAADPGLVHTAGGRFFGFVIGGSLDVAVAVAAEMVTAGWDQRAYNHVLTPAGAAAEQVTGGWLKDLLGLPATASVGFVTGACDPLREAATAARAHGAWVHVGGAFGLWAAASTRTRALVDGIELADSWGCDGHKWLNVTYDSGFVFCAHPEAHATAVRYSAAYLTGSGGAEVGMSGFTLESSRRARGFSAWAVLRHLGRSGVAELVDQLCAMAQRFAAGLEAGGGRIANEVVLNQVLVDFGDDARNAAIAEAVQQEGTCWLATTDWHGRRLLRLSISSNATTEADVDRSVESILRHAG